MFGQTPDNSSTKKGEDIMKKITINALLFSVFFLILFIFAGCYPAGYGMMGQGYATDYPSGGYASSPVQGATPKQGDNWNYCPYCGRSFEGWSGYTMGPGMMSQDYGMMGRGYGYGSQYQQSEKPMERVMPWPSWKIT
jgi:hypothetical protein